MKLLIYVTLALITTMTLAIFLNDLTRKSAHSIKIAPKAMPLPAQVKATPIKPLASVSSELGSSAMLAG